MELSLVRNLVNLDSSQVVNHIESELHPRPAVLRLYCEYTSKVPQTQAFLLRSLIRQAVVLLSGPEQKDVPQEVYVTSRAHPEGMELGECKRLLPKLISRLAQTYEKAFIVVDGLDEYVHSKGDAKFHAGTIEIFDTLKTAMESANTSCRMCVTSRPNCLDHYNGSEAMFSMIELTATAEDIRMYVASSLREDDFALSPLLRNNGALRTRVIEEIVERSQGQ